MQFISDSPWNHVAVVVRGEMTNDKEADQHITGYCHLKKVSISIVIVIVIAIVMVIVVATPCQLNI